MGYYNFPKDLEVEKKIKKFMEDKGLDVKLLSEATNKEIIASKWAEGNVKEYDQTITFVDNSTATIEWKADQKCLSTENLFIEYQSRGKDSGINITTATYWAEIVYSNEFRGKIRFGVWKTDDFKRFLADGLENGEVWHPKDLGGDDWKGGKAAAGWLTKEKTLFNSKYTLVDKKMDIAKFLKKAGIT
jgi:hypothetical protein